MSKGMQSLELDDLDKVSGGLEEALPKEEQEKNSDIFRDDVGKNYNSPTNNQQ